MNLESIIFLPWLRLKDEVTAGLYRFVPFGEKKSCDQIPCTIADRINSIRDSYRSINGKSIPDFTVVLKKDGESPWIFSTEENSEIRRLSSLLFLSSWALNRYFTHVASYSNSSLFDVIEQRFTTDDTTSVAIEFKRRDGSTLSGGHNYKSLHVIAPPHYAINHYTSVDKDFFLALLKAQSQDSTAYNLISSVINFVELANTDRDLVSTDTELILMGSVFETFLEVPRNRKAWELANRYEIIFRNYSDLTGHDIKKERPQLFVDTKDGMSLDSSAYASWAHEFYKARNEVIHSKKSDRTWAWSQLEHLLIAAYSFPLMTKILLEGEKLYVLSQEDKRRCHSLAGIISKANWNGKDLEGHSSNIWNSIMSEGYDFMLHKELTEVVHIKSKK